MNQANNGQMIRFKNSLNPFAHPDLWGMAVHFDIGMQQDADTKGRARHSMRVAGRRFDMRTIHSVCGGQGTARPTPRKDSGKWGSGAFQSEPTHVGCHGDDVFQQIGGLKIICDLRWEIEARNME